MRDKTGRVARIVEHADATDEELAVHEVNTSIYVFRRSVLAPALRRLSPDNAQGEYYLTDTIGVLHDAGYPVESLVVDDPMEAAGVNDRHQLAVAEAELRDRINERWMRRGVTMVDPEHTYVDTTVELGTDVVLYPGTHLQGSTVVASGAELGPSHPAVRLHGRAPRRGDRHHRAQRRHRGRRPRGPLGLPAAWSEGGGWGGHRSMLHWRQRERSPMTLPARPETAPHPERTAPMELVPTRRLHLLSGRTHPALAADIAGNLGLELGDANLVDFANGEVRPSFPQSVRGADVFVIQSHGRTPGRSVNDSLVEQWIMIDAAKRASAKRITAVCPYYGYSRQDRKAKGREPITARMVSDFFAAAGADRIISVDLHSGQIQGFFDGPSTI